MFFILIPYHVDIAQGRDPYLNRVLIAITAAMFFLTIGYLDFSVEQAINAGHRWVPDNTFPENFVAYGFRPLGLIGSALLHGSYYHLICNMIFLWLFGNAICSKIGNVLYIPVYFLLSFMSSYIALTFDGRPGIGASGAINGLVGMYLVFFPLNDISCAYFAYGRFRAFFGTFYLSSFWMILYWLFFDIIGLILTPENGIGYTAHIGGFVSGIGIGILILLTKILAMEKSEKSLLQVLDFREKKEPRLQISRNLAEMVKNKGVCLKKYIVVDNQNEEETITNKQNTIKDNNIDITPETLFTFFDDHKKQKKSSNAPDMTLVKNNRIYFNCSCGENLKMPVKFAGKKGRCPQCQNVIHIPKVSV